MSRSLKVLATPKDANPYQDLLYDEVRAAGVEVIYDVGPTRSQTVNLALAPAMLAWYRLRGVRLLHIHWVHQFILPWAKERPAGRAAMQLWFALYLRVATLIGLRVIWTAHDLLPHWPIFLDDARARDNLLRRCTLVFALSEATATALVGLGAPEVRIVPFGSYLDLYESDIDRGEARARLGLGDDELVVLNIGRMQPYKGADLLLEATGRLPADSPIRVVLAGQCDDEESTAELEAAAAKVGDRALTFLTRIPDDEMAVYLRAADVACFPLRAISNSSSILLAQSFSLPIVIPDLPNLSGIPAGSGIRYEPGLDGLVAALNRVASMSATERDAMGVASKAYAESLDWPTAARLTIEAYLFALTGLSARLDRSDDPASTGSA
jgi:glycosyltransferase involved in cell wall biosynthesis